MHGATKRRPDEPARWERSAGRRLTTVSYTHLDVYKRQPFAGRLIDWAGTRLGYAVAVALWSVAAMGHALARSVVGFGVARFALGLSESANFPAAIRTVADWFPQRERAMATGIFNSGANIEMCIRDSRASDHNQL